MSRQRLYSLVMATVLGFATGPALAEGELEDRLDRKGDRIEHRLDRQGDRIHERLDRKGERRTAAVAETRLVESRNTFL